MNGTGWTDEKLRLLKKRREAGQQGGKEGRKEGRKEGMTE